MSSHKNFGENIVIEERKKEKKHLHREVTSKRNEMGLRWIYDLKNLSDAHILRKFNETGV